MRQALTQQRPGGIALPDSVGSFNRRKRNSLYVTVTLLIVSVLILTVGLAATTRTQNVTVGGYYPGVILGFGSFLGIIGSNLIENKRQMLVASIVFISFGVIAAFCCAIVDGVFAARHIDLRPLYAGRCQYYSKSTTPPEAICHPQRRAPCTPKIKTNTCFCCDLYNCGNIPVCFQPPLLLASPMTPSQCHLLPAICGLPMHLLVTPRRIFHLLKSHHLIRHKECGREEILAIEIIVNILYLYFTVGGSRRIETEDNCKYD
ncbi:transmembrane protein 255A isoform X3 [Cygnus olor]|uniref:transmembrane protein 255A isoform X3 n=1 Tax=Cygnus olor TaxID=8869 RepID=UPI001ADE79E0|nr:transmembrane protein 255A isoform X3 [Cygnus olor]